MRTSSPSPPKVFIGSSSEGVVIANHLQVALEQLAPCEATVWTQGVFTASGYTLENLLDHARGSDFAVLVATGDDIVESRGVSSSTPRDNVIFELGLFFGVLGRERTFLVVDRRVPPRLPSDLAGLTYLPYAPRTDGNTQAALTSAVLELSKQIKAAGPRDDVLASPPSGSRGLQDSRAQHVLDLEIGRVCLAAEAQGWKVKTRSSTTLRLISRQGRKHTFSIDHDPEQSRAQLRRFVNDLRAHGLRINSSVRTEV